MSELFFMSNLPNAEEKKLIAECKHIHDELAKVDPQFNKKLPDKIELKKFTASINDKLTRDSCLLYEEINNRLKHLDLASHHSSPQRKPSNRV